MKANEFVKLRGVSYCKDLLIKADGCAAIQAREDNSRVSVDDLKRLVESHELVRSLNGLIGAKASIREVFEDYPHDYVSRKLYDFDVKCCAVSKAIADVESCQ